MSKITAVTSHQLLLAESDVHSNRAQSVNGVTSSPHDRVQGATKRALCRAACQCQVICIPAAPGVRYAAPTAASSPAPRAVVSGG